MQNALRFFGILSYVALATALALAQAKPTFEVASIKPAAPLDMVKVRTAIQNGEMPRLGAQLHGARAEFIYVSLQDLISLSYKVKPDQITGPDWIGNQRFDIFTKLPDGSPQGDIPKMLQALLEDRFKLVLHRENKERPVLALAVGEGGVKMKESPEDPKPTDSGASPTSGGKQTGSPDGQYRMKADTNGGFKMSLGGRRTMGYSVDPATRTMKIDASQLTMGGFADILTTLMRATGGGLEVKDMTGLTGKYPVAISFSMDELTGLARRKWVQEPNPSAGEATPAMRADAASDPGGSSSLFKAVQSMGLKLVPRKVMLEGLVIDHLESADRKLSGLGPELRNRAADMHAKGSGPTPLRASREG